MHSVSPVHIRLKSQLKNPMTAANFEDLIERKKKVKIGPSTTQKKKPVYQWTSPKKENKCDLMKRCRLDDYISPIKQHIDEPSCEVCVDVKSRSRSRSSSPEKNGQANCSFLRRLSSSTSPVSFSRSQEFDPNSTYTMPNRSKSHESYLTNRENDLLPIDENDLILKKEFLVKKLIDSESFSSDIVRVLELIREYISNCDKGLDLKTVYGYLNKDIKSLFQLIDLFHLTHRDVRSIISEFLSPETLSVLRQVKENGDILNKSEKLKLENEKFRKIISEFEKNINQTGSTNEALNMENNVLASLKQSLEDNRAHLRRQLISREAECNRLSVQLRKN
ncbi:outer dense fiber 2-like [Brachionus plicatilis]|uniref:Outer dense fiber 2-like n=1 Tax=Brachionus plicatilis TaxID=10195 RepID=A0A3M7Q3S4_BRAPC|nr:outer dense fiber 2-like [Brachionus plicatilis]